MEKEFDEITEKFKRLSIENPDIQEDEDFFIESNTEREKKHVVLTLSRTQRVEKYFINNLRRFIITNLLLQLTVEGMNFFL